MGLRRSFEEVTGKLTMFDETDDEGIPMVNDPATLGTRTVIVEHQATWSASFRHEAERLCCIVPFLALHHIGSTAVPGVLAKPIIDILGVARSIVEVDESTDGLVAAGYRALGEHGISQRRYFRKENNVGQRTYHLHVYEMGSPHIERHLAFRDYLIAHPQIAERYSSMKRSLSVLPRSEYQRSKDMFVAQVEADALVWLAAQRTGSG